MKKMLKIFFIAMLLMLFPSVMPAGAGSPTDSCPLQGWELHQNLTTGATAWNSNSTLVTLQNLSPYDMELASDGGLTDLIGTKPNNFKAVFLPTGYPTKLPKTCYPDDSTCTTVNASPLAPMVVAWQDSWANDRGFVPSLNLTYTLKNVCNADGKCGDVPLYINLSRCKPPAPKVGNFKETFNALVVTLNVLKVSLDPGSPMAWVRLLAHTDKLIQDSNFPTANTIALASTIKISAYAVSVPPPLTSCTPGGAGTGVQDTLATQAPRICYPSDDIVVQLNVFRGSYGKGDGPDRIPLAHITVFNYKNWASATVFAAIQSADQQGKLGSYPSLSKLSSQFKLRGTASFLTFGDMARTLGDDKREILSSACDKIYNGQALNEAEASLMSDLGEQLEAKAK